MISRYCLLLRLGLSSCGHAAPVLLKSQFTGMLGGASADLRISSRGGVYFVDLRIHAGREFAAVVAPAEVFLEVAPAMPGVSASHDGNLFGLAGVKPQPVSPSEPVEIIRAALSATGVFEPVVGLAGGAAPRIVATDYETFNDIDGARCRLDVRIDASGVANVHQFDCAADDGPNLSFEGVLR